MNIINVNGKNFDVVGRNIVVRNGKVIVDGIEVVGDLKNEIKVTFTGDLANLDCTEAVINGNVQKIDATTITINGNVTGDVDGTNIVCGDVGGNVEGTNVKCWEVKGDIDAVTFKKRKE
ncbi:MAG: hypothetical protein WC428_02260 [Candidatus Paceibacterota bacterium]